MNETICLGNEKETIKVEIIKKKKKLISNKQIFALAVTKNNE